LAVGAAGVQRSRVAVSFSENSWEVRNNFLILIWLPTVDVVGTVVSLSVVVGGRVRHFLGAFWAFSAALVTLPPTGSLLLTALMTPTATV